MFAKRRAQNGGGRHEVVGQAGADLQARGGSRGGREKGEKSALFHVLEDVHYERVPQRRRVRPFSCGTFGILFAPILHKIWISMGDFSR